MAYLVLARKYRPQTFEEIVGQEHITTTLKNAISQKRIGHAYLFSGPRGTGKTSTARIFAKALNCAKGPTHNPCNQCANCQGISNGNSLDVLEIDGASNRGIDEIRNLRENVKLMPAQSRYKVYIIDEVHMLSPDAFNALLKTLEEPPAHIKFIFATTAPYKILPTILSRCQRFDFKRLTVVELVAKLKEISKQEKVKIKEDAFFTIARAAEGSLRDAETILEQLISFAPDEITNSQVTKMLGMVEEDVLSDAAESILKKDAASLLALIDGLLKEGKDLTQFITALAEHFRNLLILKMESAPAGRSSGGAVIELPEESIKSLTEQGRRFTLEQLFYAVQLLLNTADALRRSPSPRTLLEMTMVRLTMMESLSSVKELLEKINGLRKEVKSPSTLAYPQPVSLKGAELKDSRMPPEKKPGYTQVKMESRPDPVKAAGSIAVEENDPRRPPQADEARAGLERVVERWDETLGLIKEEKISTGTCLAEGSPVNLSAGALTIGFSPNRLLNKECLERADAKELVERIFAEQLGEKVKVKFIITDGAEPKEENKPEPAGVENNGGRPAGPAGDNGKKAENPIANDKDILEEPIVRKAMELFDGRITRINNGGNDAVKGAGKSQPLS